MVRGMEIKALCSICLFVLCEDARFPELIQELSTLAANDVCVAGGQLQFFLI